MRFRDKIDTVHGWKATPSYRGQPNSHFPFSLMSNIQGIRTHARIKPNTISQETPHPSYTANRGRHQAVNTNSQLTSMLIPSFFLTRLGFMYRKDKHQTRQVLERETTTAFDVYIFTLALEGKLACENDGKENIYSLLIFGDILFPQLLPLPPTW